MTDKKWTIKIDPEAMKDLDAMDPEDAQAMLDHLQAAVESGEFLANMQPVDFDELKKTDPDIYERLTGERVEGN